VGMLGRYVMWMLRRYVMSVCYVGMLCEYVR
jgi:hypothetical protein